MTLQIRSVTAPLDSPDAAEAAVDVLKTMEAMGLLERDVQELSLEVLRSSARTAARAGIGAAAAAKLQAGAHPSTVRVAAALRELYLALEESPAPAFEWPAMIELFGVERLTELVGVSVASLRRYAGGERLTPDVVASRLHVLARVVAELRGAYSEVGVRRWFERRRSQLDGRAPGTLLTGDWDPDGRDAHAVLDMARSLSASPAT